MVVIDSHCHVSDLWYEPVETLLFQMDRNGVDGAVLIQILGQFDNGYQQDCLRRYPGRFASVVMVNVAEPTAIGELRRLAEDGASGVRLRPTARSVGDDPMAIWRTAADLGLSVSCPARRLISRPRSLSKCLRHSRNCVSWWSISVPPVGQTPTRPRPNSEGPRCETSPRYPTST